MCALQGGSGPAFGLDSLWAGSAVSCTRHLSHPVPAASTGVVYGLGDDSSICVVRELEREKEAAV